MKTNWKTKKFEDCLEKVVYTNKIQRKDFLKSGEFPVISQEAEYINGYWNDKADVFRTNGPVVIFGDHTQVLKYVDFDFVLGADGVKILKTKNFLDPKFFYYYLQSVNLKSLGYARHYRLLKEFEISFPTLIEQKVIVKKLDALSGETKKLEAIFRRKIADLDELKKSVLKQAFSGEL